MSGACSGEYLKTGVTPNGPEGGDLNMKHEEKDIQTCRRKGQRASVSRRQKIHDC